MKDIVKVAAAQINPKLMENADNLAKMLERTREAAAAAADLVVFPECALTGYVFHSREEALPYAETVPGPATGKALAGRGGGQPAVWCGIHVGVGAARRCVGEGGSVSEYGQAGRGSFPG